MRRRTFPLAAIQQVQLLEGGGKGVGFWPLGDWLSGPLQVFWPVSTVLWLRQVLRCRCRRGHQRPVGQERRSIRWDRRLLLPPGVCCLSLVCSLQAVLPCMCLLHPALFLLHSEEGCQSTRPISSATALLCDYPRRLLAFCPCLCSIRNHEGCRPHGSSHFQGPRCIRCIPCRRRQEASERQSPPRPDGIPSDATCS